MSRRLAQAPGVYRLHLFPRTGAPEDKTQTVVSIPTSFCAVCAVGAEPARGAGNIRVGDRRYIFPPENIMRERESAADGGISCAAEESPPTNQTRSRMQVRVARATAMTQKRYGPPSVMKRLSLERREAWETHASNSLNVAAGYDETVNPCGCKPE